MQTARNTHIPPIERSGSPMRHIDLAESRVNRSFTLAIACVTLMLLVLRMPTRLADGFLWAEDSPIFLKDAGELGLASIFKAYAGYFHLLPRLIAYVQVQWIGIDSAPHVLVWVSALVTALSCAAIFAIASRWQVFAGSRRYGAALFALAPVIIPQPGEVYLNITNLQWIVAPLMFALVLETVGSPRYPASLPPIARGALLTLLCILALTGPFALIVVPFALILMAYRRSDGLRLEAVVLLAACAIQLGAVLNAGEVSDTARSFKYLRTFSRNFVGGIFFTDEFKAAFARFLSPMSWLIVVAIGVLALLSPKRLWIFALLGLSIGLWAMGILRVNDPELILTPTSLGARYYFVPEVLVVWSLALLCVTGSRWVLWVPCSLLAMMLTTTAMRFPVERFEAPSVVQKGDDAYSVKSAPEGWGAEIDPPE